MPAHNYSVIHYIFLLWLLFQSFPASASSSTPTILVFGDSLSAGYGIERGEEWPTYLQKRLNNTKFNYAVANHSSSGETTAGGLARLSDSLESVKPSIIILALGSNDGLRGLSMQTMKANLQAMIDLGQKHKAKVLLVGMHIPTNYGPAYTQLFHQQYDDLAKANPVSYLPFLLQGIAEDIAQFQPDGLHPVAEVQPRIAATVWRALEPLLKYEDTQ